MRLFTLVLVALLFCCAGLFAAPPRFVVENKTAKFEVSNKTGGFLSRVVTSCQLTPDGNLLTVISTGAFGRVYAESFPVATTVATYNGVAGLSRDAPAWFASHPGATFTSGSGRVDFISAYAAKPTTSVCGCGLTGVCGCTEEQCVCPECRRTRTTPTAPQTGARPVHYVQQCVNGRCTLVPVYP